MFKSPEPDFLAEWKQRHLQLGAFSQKQLENRENVGGGLNEYSSHTHFWPNRLGCF